MSDDDQTIYESHAENHRHLRAALPDRDLMGQNIAGISAGEVKALRVSAEHYLWLCGGHTLVKSIVHTAGGLVEGRPTEAVNILQRIRKLVEIEQERQSLFELIQMAEGYVRAGAWREKTEPPFEPGKARHDHIKITAALDYLQKAMAGMPTRRSSAIPPAHRGGAAE